jgi:hypothetical protein
LGKSMLFSMPSGLLPERSQRILIVPNIRPSHGLRSCGARYGAA